MINDEAVESRAKEIFRRERRHMSVRWNATADESEPDAPSKPPLGERAREEYRARAREELRAEAEGAQSETPPSRPAIN